MAICKFTDVIVHENDPDIIVTCQKFFDEFEFLYWKENTLEYVYRVNGKYIPEEGELTIIFKRIDGKLEIVDVIQVRERTEEDHMTMEEAAEWYNKRLKEA